ncbi:MAG: hypothetical protein ACTSUQ_10460, partial [Candidatus Freyarchaeota archaeon]
IGPVALHRLSLSSQMEEKWKRNQKKITKNTKILRIYRPEPDPLPAHPNPGLVEDDVACALQRPLEVAPRGAVGAVHPPANRPGGCARSPARPGEVLPPRRGGSA